MNKFLSILLTVLTLGLGSLVVYQWNFESRLLADRQSLQDKLSQRDRAVQALQANLKRVDLEVERVNALKAGMTGTLKTNRLEIDALRKSLERAEKEGNTLRDLLGAYKQAVDKQNDNLKRQNEIITEQNAKMKSMAVDRNTVVEKFNKLANDYNQLVKDYTKLADRFKAATTLPAALSQPADPPPPSPPGN